MKLKKRDNSWKYSSKLKSWKRVKNNLKPKDLVNKAKESEKKFYYKSESNTKQENDISELIL